jgi:DNA-binding IclR family transcriptional regulator
VEAVAAVVVVVVVVVVAVAVLWPAYVSKAPVLAIITERVRSVARAIAGRFEHAEAQSNFRSLDL